MLPDADIADADERAAAQARLLEASHGASAPHEIIALVTHELFEGRVAVVSSFGAESAVLLHMISQIDRATPVLFLDTGKHFRATLYYRHQLVGRLGLADVRDIPPVADSLAKEDPFGALSMTDKDRCCFIRKVEPMARAVAPYRAWMTGRKQFQASTRNGLPVFESVGPRIRINPLARWRAEDLRAYAEKYSLPPHPLTAQGYRSIGCMPCTRPVSEGEDQRAGRWAGSEKTECGIHLSGLADSLKGIPKAV
ncbi:phosphoadenylyl-sulfate reductase [Brucella suis]|uniref:phosphoadenylyl-sulfate reductase n=1 Tax=Brucella suis TaxID=29461 RepID=UPI0001B488AE|nr:phosphoadenylyl-sulfate reductase [Brucella suis]AIJ70699.1 phosophoadenylyl-sulfate reductase family protein [Brucella suis bv. 3 str. 686]EEY33751.1 phosphoadenosine phosphosulfate reductase [Brucella suis bv. 3 str. 686]QOK60392.1 phosphoadenylyl-sulfate reductase [Brucella suis bv. 3]